MNKISTQDFKKKFRVYKGEEECPYNQDSLEERRNWFMWKLEKCLAEAEPQEVVDRFNNHIDDIPQEIGEADVTDQEKAAAFYLYTAADTMMAKKAFAQYFAMPIVFED